MWKYLLLLFFISLSSIGSAQPGRLPGDDSKDSRHERIRLARQAFITEQLELSEAEVAAFFPVFWDFQKQLEDTKRNGVRSRRPPFENSATSDLSEEEAKAAIIKAQQERRKEVDLTIAAENRYLEILSAKKVLKLEPAERAFRKKLWDRMGHQRKRN